MKRQEPSRPLIEEAEGRDADRRSSLYSAFKRIANRTDRPAITNIHVRELLMWVMAADRNGSGVQKSYPELAALLETTVSTARAVVRRAEKEFGLLAVIEDRHARGGQTANRYSIDWPVVREINMGIRPAVVSQQAPAVTRQAPVVSQQAPVVTRQPYKEYIPESYPEAKASPSSPPSPNVAPDVATWEQVEEEVSVLLGDWKTAVRAAQSSHVTPDHVLAIVKHWRTLAPRLGPGALYQRLRNARPNVAPDVGWPKSLATSPASRQAQAGAIRADVTVQANCIISAAIKAGRREGLPEPQITARIQRDLQAAGLDAEKYYPSPR